MKVAKIIGWSVGSLLLLGGGLAGLALTPAVQTWAVRKAVAGQPGLKLEVGRVSAGFSSAELEDLRLEQDGVVLSAQSVTARYSAWDYLASGRVNVDQLQVADLTADLRGAAPGKSAPTTMPSRQPPPGSRGTPPSNVTARPAPPPSPTPPAADAFTGVLTKARVPMPVRVVAATINGRAVLSAAQTATFEARASNIVTGEAGKLEWQIGFLDASPGAPVASAELRGSAGLHLAGDGRLEFVELESTAAAQGPKLPPDRLRLQARATQPQANGNENYTLAVSLLRGGSAEPLAQMEAALDARTREVAGAWNLTLRSEQLAAVLGGLGLPELAAAGRGSFAFRPDSGAVAAKGELKGDVGHLEKIAPELAAIGAVRFAVDFDAGLEGGVGRLDRLQLDVTAADGRRIAQIAASQRVGLILAERRVTLANPDAELARVTLQALPLAWAQPFLPGLSLQGGTASLTLAVESAPDGSRIRIRSVEPLSLRDVTIAQRERKLVEALSLSTGLRGEYSATGIQAELPDLQVTLPAGDRLSARLSAGLSSGQPVRDLRFSAETQLQLIGAHRPYLPLDPGPLVIRARTEGAITGDALTVAQAAAEVTREGGSRIVSAELLQTLAASLRTGAVAADRTEPPAVRMRVGEVPLAWLEAFVPGLKASGVLAGTTVEITLRGAEDVALTTVEPVVVRGATASFGGRPAVRSLDLIAMLQASRRGQQWAYDVRRLELREGKIPLLTLTAAGETALAGPLVLAAKGRLEADAAAWLTQPFATGSALLAQGKVSSTFDVSISDVIRAKATLGARSLVARQENRVLGDLDLALETSLEKDGSGTFNVPVTLTNAGRKSDLALSGTFSRTSDRKGFVFNGRIASGQLHVDDFMPLAAIASPAEPAPAPAASRPPAPPGAPAAGISVARGGKPGTPVRDPQPFWQGVQGKLAVELKQVVYGKDYAVRDLRGILTVTESRLAVDGLEGLLNQDPFRLGTTLTFDARQPQPYGLAGTANIRNLDIGHLLRSANPGQPPALESRLSITANFTGNGGSPADLARNVRGKFDLNGGQGVLRALARQGGASQMVNLASAALQILGAARGSDTAVALGELAGALREVPFDRIKVQAERAADLSFRIGALELISPVLRTTGTGTLAAKPGVEFQDQILEVQLQLGAKGNLGYLLQRAGALSNRQDDKGYYLVTRPFRLGGTPANPDSSALWKFLGELAAGGLLR